MRFDSATLVANTIVSGSFEITGTTVPGDNSSYDLGSVSKSWRTIYSTALSGSLTKLAGGGDYLVAGTGIQLSTGSSGAVTIASTAVTSPGGLDTHVQFKDGSTFGGNSGLSYNKTAQALTGTYIVASTGFSGSLTKLSTGGDYLIAGTGIVLSTGSSGAVTITSAVAGSSLIGGSDTQVQFNDASSFAGDNGLTYNKTTQTLTGKNIVATTGLSGSLTKLSDGITNYLQAGSGIYIVTQSNGSILITGSSQVTLGGTNTNVQFNDGGVLGGDANFTFNKSTDTLTVTNLSGSLTKLSTGGDYLVAGSGIQLSTGSSGAVTITSTVAGSSLIGGSNTQVQFNDNNSFAGNGGLTYNKNTGALTGTYVVASTGFSGSLTKLASGGDYLRAGSNITLTTGSNGSVTIDSSLAPYTVSSFTNVSTVVVNHNLGLSLYDIEVFDTSYNKIIPKSVTATSTTQATITFGSLRSGFVIVGSPGGSSAAGSLQSAVYVGVSNAQQSSVGENTPINIQQTLYSLGSDITRPTNSRFTLSGPGSYKLQAIIGYSNSNVDYAGFRWYDVTNSTYVGTQSVTQEPAAAYAATTIPVAYVTISTPTTYELRQNFGGVSVTLFDVYTQVEITKVTGFTSALGITQTVGSAPYYGARAFVNFNGTAVGETAGTVAIRASGNVSSVTDNGVGDYTINFTTAMPDVSYSVVGTATHGAAANDVGVIGIRGSSSAATLKSTTQVRVDNTYVSLSGAGYYDSPEVCIIVIR